MAGLYLGLRVYQYQFFIADNGNAGCIAGIYPYIAVAGQAALAGAAAAQGGLADPVVAGRDVRCIGRVPPLLHRFDPVQ